MVITKQECESLEVKDLQNGLESACKSIDDALIRGDRSVSVDKLKNFVDYNKEKFVSVIEQKYRQAGWKVDRDSYSDHRDSWDVLKFS
jgi:hypothetical protein